jgi:hypothetical protein
MTLSASAATCAATGASTLVADVRIVDRPGQPDGSQRRPAGGVDEVPIGVEGELQPADIGVVTGGGHDRHHHTVSVLGVRRVLAADVLAAAAADDRVDVTELGHEGELLVDVLQVAGEHDDVDPSARSARRPPPARPGAPRRRHVARTRDRVELLVVAPMIPMSRPPVVTTVLAAIRPSSSRSASSRLTGEVEVRREERDVTRRLDEVGEQVRTEVELVVADRHRVEVPWV